MVIHRERAKERERERERCGVEVLSNALPRNAAVLGAALNNSILLKNSILFSPSLFSFVQTRRQEEHSANNTQQWNESTSCENLHETVSSHCFVM